MQPAPAVKSFKNCQTNAKKNAHPDSNQIMMQNIVIAINITSALTMTTKMMMAMTTKTAMCCRPGDDSRLTGWYTVTGVPPSVGTNPSDCPNPGSRHLSRGWQSLLSSAVTAAQEAHDGGCPPFF